MSLDGRLTRLELSPGGGEVVRRQTLALLQTPLDVTAQGPGDVFPGTIWIAGYGPQGRISVLEPRDAAGWRDLPPSGLRRQEVSYVELGGKRYLAGGDRHHQLYDPVSRTWRDLAPLPARLDHIQGVALGGRIYYVSGLERWPKPHSDTVFVYDPASDSFSEGAPMPRPRGAGGVATYGEKIYYAGAPRREGSGVVRRLRPGDGALERARGHAAGTRPLPGGRPRRPPLRDRGPRPRPRPQEGRQRGLRLHARRVGDKPRAAADASWRVRSRRRRERDPRHRRRDEGARARDGGGLRHRDRSLARSRSASHPEARDPGRRLRRRRLRRGGREGARRRRADRRARGLPAAARLGLRAGLRDRRRRGRPRLVSHRRAGGRVAEVPDLAPARPRRPAVRGAAGRADPRVHRCSRRRGQVRGDRHRESTSWGGSRTTTTTGARRPTSAPSSAACFTRWGSADGEAPPPRRGGCRGRGRARRGGRRRRAPLPLRRDGARVHAEARDGAPSRGACVLRRALARPAVAPALPRRAPRGSRRRRRLPRHRARAGRESGLRSTAEMWAYDPSRREYRELPALPVRLDHVAAVSYRGTLYVVGGWRDGAPSAVLEIYDFRTGRWTHGPDMPTARHHHGAAALAGKPDVVGGRNPGDYGLDTVEVLDPRSGRWSRGPRLPLGSGGLGVVSVAGAIVAASGGDDHEGWVTPAAWALRPGQGWIRLADLNVPRHGHATVALGSTVYVFGDAPCPGYGRTDTAEALRIAGGR